MHRHTVYPTPEAAKAVADQINADEKLAYEDSPEEAWSYKVRSNEKGKSIIEAYDEDGFCMGPI
ncbi:hypothetical protein [Lewinella sp. W8]|uniref:hypothetical protein n=1 Tax=Lewinella sp. W8 TaxID=2528208 RepID=UPI0010675523|nr:hypothetical protein [Lewinella sp. W8]MTB53031.1 hypothetical protein [Lewinella sp. W8]